MNKTKTIVLIVLIYFVISQITFAQSTSTLSGTVLDSDSGKPVEYAYLLINKLNIQQKVNNSGEFELTNLPEGIYSVQIYRFGYKKKIKQIQLFRGKTTSIIIYLTPDAIKLSEVIKRDSVDTKINTSGFTVNETKIREHLGLTIAKTLELEPGLDKISMGPAPARPVLRGLGGDRLLILENGERTGDLSATSADHAVAIDPLTSTKIEILRGPEAFIYGSNVIGGVINVERNEPANKFQKKFSGTVQLQGESVNSGYGSALNFTLPVSEFNLRSDFSYRKTKNIKTPEGDLQNTYIKTLNGSIGINYFFNWGQVDVSGGNYSSDYGIPPDPIEGHPLGVDIELNKTHFSFVGIYNKPFNIVKNINMKYQYSDYFHKEYESSGSLGMEFDVLTNNISTIINFSDFGLFKNSKIGYWFEHRDYVSGGLTFTPNSLEISNAIFVYTQLDINKFSFSGTFRFDAKSINPGESYFSNRAGLIRKRNFSDYSVSIAGVYQFNSKLSANFTFQRTFRAPGVEELFSEGPHLAAYSYEVGNADLSKETGTGIELSVLYNSSRLKLSAAFYHNAINNYILPKNTGVRSQRRADLFLYQYSGLDAILQGYELTFNYSITESLESLIQVQGVNGKFQDVDYYIPRMPPVSGKIKLMYKQNNLSVGFLTKLVAEQNKTGEFETSTSGYIINNLDLSYLISTKNLSHSITFSVENISNTKYRHHLSRIKNVMPEPGRNFKLLYKVYF